MSDGQLGGYTRPGIPFGDDPWGLSPEERERAGPAVSPDALWSLLESLNFRTSELRRHAVGVTRVLRRLERAHVSVGQWGAAMYLAGVAEKAQAVCTLVDQAYGAVADYNRRAIDPDSEGFGEQDEQSGRATVAEDGGVAVLPPGPSPDPGGGAASDPQGEAHPQTQDRGQGEEA